MAAAVSATASQIELRVKLVDVAGESTQIVIPLGGTTLPTNTEIEDFLDAYDALSNAGLECSVVKVFAVSGLDFTPSSSSQNLVAAILAMEFEKTNPINTAKVVSKSVRLPSYIDAIRNNAVTPHVPVTTNANLNIVTAFLEDFLDYVGADGLHYPSGWSFNPGSKFGTQLSVTDGF